MFHFFPKKTIDENSLREKAAPNKSSTKSSSAGDFAQTMIHQQTEGVDKQASLSASGI